MKKILTQTGDVMRAEKAAVLGLLCTAGASEASVVRSSLDQLSEMDGLAPDYVPIGSVEFCLARMGRLGIARPPHMSYPPALRDYLKREIVARHYADVAPGAFVKPVDTVKLFTGHLKGAAHPEDAALLQNAADLLVWTCVPVEFNSEVRYYIIDGEVAGHGRYDNGPDDADIPDMQVVKAAVSVMNRARPPAGYALDFGVTRAGTSLVEANDGWALGLYRSPFMAAEDYLHLLSARWREIISQ